MADRIYQVTIPEITEVFRRWAQMSKEEPEKYRPFEDSEQYAVSAAKEFIWQLESIWNVPPPNVK